MNLNCFPRNRGIALNTKKQKWITITLYLMFLIGLIVTMYIILTDKDTPYSFGFVIGFVLFLLFFALFQMFNVFMNIKRLPLTDIKKRLLKFVGTFAFLMVVTWTLNYIFRPERLYILDFGIPLGLAIGMTFYDLMQKK